MKVIIALVSDQRMQNLIPLFQQGYSYSRLVLVLSKERATGQPANRFLDAADHIAAVVRQVGTQVEHYEAFVDPFKIEDTEQTVIKCIEALKDENDVDVNFTGGTKPMAVGALQAAQAQGVRAVYVNTEDNELLWWELDRNWQVEPIQVRNFGIDHYIEAYGEQVCEKASVESLDLREIEWANVIATQHTAIYPVIKRLNQQTKRTWKDKSGYPVVLQLRPTRKQRKVIEHLAAAGLWDWDVKSSKLSLPDLQRASFLNGDWVEIYTAASLDRSGCFDEVALNIKLKGVEGEIDVALVKNGRLALFECKSNVQQSQQLAKLDSFRKNLGGPYALAFYVRASQEYARQVTSQAQKWKITHSFLGPGLATLADTVAKLMEQMP